MKKKAGFQRRFSSRYQLSVLVPIVLLLGLGPQASAKKAPASESLRLYRTGLQCQSSVPRPRPVRSLFDLWVHADRQAHETWRQHNR
jgi:hypothetical protein